MPCRPSRTSRPVPAPPGHLALALLAVAIAAVAAAAAGLTVAGATVPAVTGVAVASAPTSPTVALDAPDPDIVVSGSTYYTFTTGATWGNSLGALVDTSGSPEAGWATSSGRAYGSSALPDPPSWEQPGTQTSPGVFFWGGRWVMYYDAATAGNAGDTGHDCLAMATAASLSPPVFTDTSTSPFACQPSLGGSIDPSPFVDPATGDAWLVWKSNDGGSSLPAYLWSAELNASGTGFVTQPTELLTNDTVTDAWEATVEDPQMVDVDGAYLLLFSGGLWGSSGYAEGFASCQGPQGPCSQPRSTPFLSSYGDVAGPGGASAVQAPDGTWWLAYAAWSSGCVGYGACGGTAARQLYVAPLAVTVGAGSGSSSGSGSSGSGSSGSGSSGSGSSGSGSSGSGAGGAARPAVAGGAHVVALAPTPDGQGYWEAASDGGVFAFGDAGFFGSLPGLPAAAQPGLPVVGFAATPDGRGYWEATAGGDVYSFGDATFHGSTGALTLAEPIMGMAPTADGQGYWLVASDGGVFAFGDAGFHGSLPGLPHAEQPGLPVVGLAPTPDGQGYWEVTSGGDVYSFGDATFHGSTGALALNRSVVGMSPTPDGQGYWLVAADGGIFGFGDAAFRGSTGALTLAKPVVAMSPTPDGQGYWLVAADGGVFAFGDAAFHGSMAGQAL